MFGSLYAGSVWDCCNLSTYTCASIFWEPAAAFPCQVRVVPARGHLSWDGAGGSSGTPIWQSPRIPIPMRVGKWAGWGSKLCWASHSGTPLASQRWRHAQTASILHICNIFLLPIRLQDMNLIHSMVHWRVRLASNYCTCSICKLPSQNKNWTDNS